MMNNLTSLAILKYNSSFSIKKTTLMSQKSSRNNSPQTSSINYCQTDRDYSEKQLKIKTQISRQSISNIKIRNQCQRDDTQVQRFQTAQKVKSNELKNEEKKQLSSNFSKPNFYLNLEDISSCQIQNRSTRMNSDRLFTEMPYSSQKQFNTTSTVVSPTQNSPSNLYIRQKLFDPSIKIKHQKLLQRLKARYFQSKNSINALYIMWLEIDNIQLKTDYKPSINKINKQYKLQDVQANNENLYKKLMVQTTNERNLKDQQIQEYNYQKQLKKHTEQKILLEEQQRQFHLQDWQRQLTKLQQKRQNEIKRITIYLVCIASQLNYLHNELPKSKRFAQLVSKHFLEILNYNSCGFVSNKFINESGKKLSKKVEKQNRFSQQKIKEHKIRLNSGAIGGSRQSTMKQIQTFMATKREFIATDHFSPKMIKYIKILQNALKMGLLKLKKSQIQHKLPSEKTTVSLKVKRPSIMIKTVKFNEKRKALFKDTSQTSVILQQPSKQLLSKHQGIDLFKAIQIAINTFQSGSRLALSPQTPKKFYKNVQQLNYPIIKFTSIVDKKFVLWKIKVKELALDRKCLYIFFNASGQQESNFRLDIPIIQTSFLEISEQITIWPTILQNLKCFFQEGSYKKMYDASSVVLEEPHSYKVNFLCGVNIKTLNKLQPVDIDSMVESKTILQFLQTKQVFRVRKLVGHSYKILPLIHEQSLNSQTKQVFLIDIPKIDKLISQIKQFDEDLRQCKISQFLDLSIKTLIQKQQALASLIQQNIILINKILYFKFVSNSILFRNDMTLQMLNKIKKRSNFIQASMINIKPLLMSQVGDVNIKGQIGNFCLLTLQIHMKDSVWFSFKELLYPQINSDSQTYQDGDYMQQSNKSSQENQTLLSYKDKSSQWCFNDDQFFTTIDVIFFEKEANPVEENPKEAIPIIEQDRLNSPSFQARSRGQTDIKNTKIFSPLQLELSQFSVLVEAVQKGAEGLKGKGNFSSILRGILLDQNVKLSHTLLIDQVMKDVFTLDFVQKKVVISKKHAHVLNKTQNFINAMELIGKNKGDDMQVIKYSIYPFEAKDLFVDGDQHRNHNEDLQEGIRNTTTFTKTFQEIYVADLKHKHDKLMNVSKMGDFMGSEQKQFKQSKFVDVTKSSNKASADNSYITNIHSQVEISIIQEIRIEVIHRGISLFITVMENFQKHKNDFKYKITIIFRKKDIKYTLFTNNTESVAILKNCTHQMNTAIRFKQINSVIFKILIECCNNFGNFLQQQGIKHLYHPPHQLNNQSNVRIPNYNQIKHKLISNSTDLLLWLNKIYFIFLFPGYQVDVIVYYSDYKDRSHFQGSRAIHNDSVERLYFCDEEYFFIHLQFYEVKSKMKKFKLIFNKYDLKDLLKSFNLKFDQPFGAAQIYEWTSELFKNIRFRKRFFYKIPQIKSEKFLIGFYNNFQKNHFDQTKIKQKYLESQQKVFRIIGHFIQKLYIVTNIITTETHIISQILFMKNRYSPHNTTIRSEFCITTLMAHQQIDLWRITYYFPRSKRQLTNYVTVINLQELDYKDTEIFRILDFDQLFTNYQHLEQYLLKLNFGKLFMRKQTFLDNQILDKVRYKKLINQSPSRRSDTFLQGNFKLLFEISKDFQTRSSGIKKSMLENKERQSKVQKFLTFTRGINKSEDGKDTQMKFIEMKIWSVLLNQALSLEISVPNDIQHIRTNLQDKLIEYYKQKLGKVRKQHKVIGKTFLMKRQILQNPQNHIKVQSLQLTQLIDLIETQNIQFLEPLFVDSKLSYSLRIGQGRFQIIEFIRCIQFKLENLGHAYVEFFVETLVINKQTLQQQATSIFTSFIPIPYINTFDYNIYLRFYVYDKQIYYRDVNINLREVLNLFISDGLFKSYTNYMSSKINLSDIESMCQYITFKIQTQNYLNLAHLIISPQLIESPLLEGIQYESDYGKQSVIDGQIYARTIKDDKSFTLFQLQIFRHSSKITVNRFNSKTAKFRQKEYSFHKADKLIPYFSTLVKAGKINDMLHRLFLVITGTK